MAKPELWLPIPGKSLSQEVDRLFDELIHRRWGAQPGTSRRFLISDFIDASSRLHLIPYRRPIGASVRNVRANQNR